MHHETLTMRPVAKIENDFKEKFGIPRQSGRARTLSRVILIPPYDVADAVRKIEGFSHLWLIFGFSLNERRGKNGEEREKSSPAEKRGEEIPTFSPLVRPPRLGGNEKAGVFATRSPFRPNPIGLSCVKIEKISFGENDRGVTILVSGADLADGTPIYDIKPYLPSADKIEDARGGFADEFSSHRLEVIFPEELLDKIPEKKRAGLLDCLKDDPRPSYQDDPTRIYGMRFADFNVRFSVNGDILTVSEVKNANTD